MNREEFQKKLIKYVDSGGGVNATARRLGVSPSFISQVYTAQKAASGVILDAMGYTKEVRTVVNYFEVKK